MAMTFPFETLLADGRQTGLVVALVIGFAFGFVLERAGFGRSTKLAAQFYLRDMTVFKVMFSAIVTAMLGLVIASSLGFASLREISGGIASWTYYWPMLAAGLLLGVGFIISGYCPGTSVVAAGSGNVDGIVTVGGVVAGTFLYSELMRIPSFAAFHTSGEAGALYLYDLLGIAPQLLAAIVAVAALAAFIGAEKVERWMARPSEAGVVSQPNRRFAFGTVAVLAVAAAALFTLPTTHAAALEGSVEKIAVRELAHRIVSEPWKLRIVDLRSAEEFTKGSLPGSEHLTAEELANLDVSGSREVVIVASSPLPKELPVGPVRLLDGGFASWRDYALTPPTSPSESSIEARSEYDFRLALHRSLTGARPAASPAAAARPSVPRPKKKGGGGCSA
jgi:rhodanese-related sulfurtransferase